MSAEIMGGRRALGGGVLRGENLVRFAYLDDAGTGKIAADPNAVIAGVIVHADRQWREIDAHLNGLADKYVPTDARDGFVFHATELFSGGKIFCREKFDKEYRWKILEEICDIPHKFGLPVIMASVPRATYALPSSLESVRGGPIAGALALAASSAAICVERWMRENTKNEIATIVYENNDQSKAFIKSAHNFLRSMSATGLGGDVAKYLPLERIVETAHFAAKDDSSVLQVADACAFALSRKLKGGPDSERFANPLLRQMVAVPKSWVRRPMMGVEF
jgi:hypothetical protein